MGYTHYFRQGKHATSAQWQAICDEFKELMASALIHNCALPIQREEDDAGQPLIDETQIIFNGRGDDAHETMVLEGWGAGFQFCKTARKPYDRAVIALLLIANKHAPDVWEISSDGTYEEWAMVEAWLAALGLEGYKIPGKILLD